MTKTREVTVKLTAEQEKARQEMQHILALRSEYRMAKDSGDKAAAQRLLAKHTKASQDYRSKHPLD